MGGEDDWWWLVWPEKSTIVTGRERKYGCCE